MASGGISLLLATEESRARPAEGISGSAGSHPPDVTGQSLWGAPKIHGELLKLGIEVSQGARTPSRGASVWAWPTFQRVFQRLQGCLHGTWLPPTAIITVGSETTTPHFERLHSGDVRPPLRWELTAPRPVIRLPQAPEMSCWVEAGGSKIHGLFSWPFRPRVRLGRPERRAEASGALPFLFHLLLESLHIFYRIALETG